MKKTVLLSFLVFLLYSTSLHAQATFTVADGDVTNSYVPVYGWNTDRFLREQIIYPASILTSLVGSNISSMTFYLSTPPSSSWGSVFNVSLGVTASSAFNSNTEYFLTDATTVLYTGTLTVNSNNTMTVTFSSPFFYTGGNLLLDISTVTKDNNYSSAYFTGIQSQGGSAYDYASGSLAAADDPSVVNFIPKTTFHYTLGNTCMHPFNLSVSDVAGSSAMIQWRNFTTFTPDHYEVSYKQADANAWTVLPDAITSEHYMLTGLQPQTDYQVRVRAFCDASTPTDYTDTVNFTTICSGGYTEDTYIGTGTNTNYGDIFPTRMYNKYCYSQQLYLANELGGAHNIDAIYLQYFNYYARTRNIDIYLGHTDKTYFASNTGWVTSDNLTKVFSGSITFDNSGEDYWFKIPFDTVFAYNGTDNLVIAFDDNTGSSGGSANRFYTNYYPSYASIYISSDNTNYTPQDPPSGSRNNNRMNLRLPGDCISTGCDAANVSVADITDTSARIVFTAGVGNTGCEMQYKRTRDNNFITLPTNGNSYLLTGLSQNTEYVVQIRSLCASGQSQWRQVIFTTSVLDLPRLYVKAGGTGNGSSWAKAMGDLNDALSTAEAIKSATNTIPDIWVAQGIYYGDSVSANAFTIREGINVYGGFAGDEPDNYDLSQRDFTAHPSILDGQHSQRVLFQESNFATSTEWNGFTIQNGNASGNGGGALLLDMTNLRHCVVRDNTASSNGGGIYIYNSSYTKYGTIEHCTVTHNTATSNAGGIFSRYGIMHHCIISHNQVTSSNGYGGGVYAEFTNTSVNMISNCLVANNTAARGGGIYSSSNCFVENTTVVCNLSTTGCAGVLGGRLHNCIAWGNQQGTAASNVSTTANYCTYSAVEGGCPGTGNISLMPESFDNGRYYPYFVLPALTAGHTDTTENVDWHLQNGSICVNRGGDNYVNTPDSTDLDGTARVKQGTVDMGCYESDHQGITLPNYGDILYVKVNGSGDHTGTSWDNALGSISDALSLAQMFNADIWIAEGIYYGDSVSESAFVMVDGVSMYGGFVGNEPADYDLTQRDLDAHVTILDGQHSQRLLYQTNSFTKTTTVDGFIIRNGYSSGTGGGGYFQKKIVLSNCHFMHNRAQQSGGGAYCSGNSSDSVFITHCTFTHNFAGEYGGGLDCGYAKVSDCVFSHDTATSYQKGYGGGLYASYSEVVRCVATHNYCNMQGGGISVSYSTVSQCEITHNKCNNNGGGVYLGSTNNNNDQVTLSNCLIANNTAAYGAGIYNGQSYNIVRNLTVVCNTITNSNTNNTGAGAYAYAYSSSSSYSLTIQNSIFWGNRLNGVVNNIEKNNDGSSITVSHCAIEGGYANGDNIVTLMPESFANGFQHPHFVNPALNAGYEDDTPNPDWHLANGSPCINKGDNSMAGTSDLDGNGRIQQNVVDLGCYESPYTEVALPTYGDIIYVTEQGAGTGTGESWANAASSIQDAIDLATTHHAVVWVAAGTYYGDTESDNAFTMREGVSVYGGFAGNEPADYDLSQRNFVTNTTILDGQSSRRVLYQPVNFTEATAVTWDGFTIQFGWSKEDGAGVYLRTYSTLSHCVVQYNTLAPVNNSYYTTFHYGGGIYAAGSSVTVGGVKHRTTRISYCKIQYNNIENTNYLEGGGGGLYAYRTDVDHTEICHNTSVVLGGGLYQSDESTVSNCLIHNNTAYRGGGVCASNSVTFLNCDIVNNTATNNGGGYYRYNGTPVFTNCIIWGNKKDYIVNNINGSGTFTYCAVEDGQSGTGNVTIASANDGMDASQYYVRFNNWENGDYSLHPTSSCVNAGNTNVMTDSLDFYGEPRIYGNTVDIGCSEVQAQNNCSPVINLQVNNITTNSAQLNWHPTGSESQWTVIYGETGGSTNTMTVNDTICTLSGLSFNRSYTAKVRAICNSEQMSVFSISVNFQTICDPTILDTLSNFSQMTPTDSGLVYQNVVTFSWASMPEATSYDFYLWADGSPEPATPTQSGLTFSAINGFSLPNYARGKYYHWKVVAWNECISKSSPVMTFRVNPIADLHVTSITHSTPVAGQPMTITWTVTNDGEGCTPPGQSWPDYIWLSSDADVRYHFADANHNLATVTNLQSLNPGESYTNSTTVTLPEGIMGNFYLFVIAGEVDAVSIDFSPVGGVAPNPYTPSITGNPYPYLFAATHVQFFTDDIVYGCFRNESEQLVCNNWGHDNFFYVVLNVLPPPSADLVVSSVAHPANTFSGNTIPLTWTVSNHGEAMALGSWYDAVYLTSDTLLDTDEAWRVGRFQHTGTLLVDSSYSRTEQVTIPIDYMGEYRFFIVTDNFDDIYEGFYNENNTGMSEHPLTVTLTPPADLIVSNVTMSDTVDINSNCTVHFTVKNNGSNPTYGNVWQDAIYLSPSPVFDPTSARLLKSLRHTGVLPADSSYHKQTTISIPTNLTAGTWYLLVYTDKDHNIFEYNYDDNNVTAYPLTVQLPDLAVSNIVVPDTVDPNGITRVTWTVRNNGPGNVVSRSFTDNIVFNGENVYTANVTNVNLAAGDSMVRFANVQIPCPNGEGLLNVSTDVTEAVLEGNESNNTRTVPLNILTPDLAVTSVTLSEESLWSGTNVAVTYTVVNNGTMPAYSNITDKVFFSTSAVNYQDNGFSGQNIHNLLLAPGESETFTTTVMIPNGISGQYYCHVQCNATNTLCETATANNIGHSAAVNVQLSPWPDLVVTQLTVQPPVYLGAPFQVQYTIQNNGTAALHNAEAVQKFYYSTSPSIFDTNKLILSTSDYLNLAIGESVTNTANMVIPATELQRYYYLYIVTDADDNIYEHTDENNNTTISSNFLAQIYQLDLEALEIVGPDTVEWGQTATYRLHVHNNSQVPTIATQWHDAMYLSNDQTLQNSDQLLQMVGHQTVLNANDDYWVNFTLTVPFGTQPNVFLLGYADFNSDNPDINHSNNSTIKAITVNSVPTPDIAVTDMTVVGDVVSGQPARIAYTVTNIGEQDISLRTWTDKLFLSSNNTYESTDIELVSKPRHNVSLSQGGTYTDTLTFTIPLPQNGDMYLLVKANSANNPYETNQVNNVMSTPVSIALPLPGDLTVTDVTCESSIISGSVIHASWNIHNIGDNNMYGNGLRTLVYVSADTAFDANDRLLGSVVSDINIAPDGTLPQTFNSRISGLAAGEYYLIVKTDVTNAFNEVNETNNAACSAEPFTVTIRPLPFNTDVADMLYNNEASDFRLDVGDNLSQTVRIHLTSADSAAGAVNMIYATYNELGDNLNYNYSTIGQFTGNPELYIPSTRPGYYGVSVYGNTPAGDAQNTVIRADILPFELRTVEADHGGNTGVVTVELTGSHFRPDMEVCLRNNNDTICADSLIYVNYYKAFARFDLTNRTPGMYDVSAMNFCEGESVLYDGFEIQEGEPNGLGYNLIFPSSPRPNRNIVMMLEFGNTGNIDLHDQVLEITSMAGSPIALTPEEVSQGNITLLVPLTIEGQPEGLLRPGSYGTINIYGFTSGGLIFTIKPANE